MKSESYNFLIQSKELKQLEIYLSSIKGIPPPQPIPIPTPAPAHPLGDTSGRGIWPPWHRRTLHPGNSIVLPEQRSPLSDALKVSTPVYVNLPVCELANVSIVTDQCQCGASRWDHRVKTHPAYAI